MVFNCLKHYKQSASEIIPGVWVGNYKAAHDRDFIEKNDISVVVNCTRSIDFAQSIPIEKYRVPVDDSRLEKDFVLMEKHFDTVLPLLVKKYKVEKKNILIHCKKGKQRSCIVLAAFLQMLILVYKEEYTYISQNKESIDDIKKFINSKRPQAFMFGLRINFRKSYERYFRF